MATLSALYGVRDQLAEVLREEAGRWREAAVLGEYRDALERRLVSA
jgi:hypothetical protein